MTTQSNNNNSSSSPSLPPLYFEGRRNNTSENCFANDSANSSKTPELPSEIKSMCFAYCNWGDLAKLACVQTSWSNIMEDAAAHSQESKWELALSLLDGAHGLQKNPVRALKLLKELANIEINDSNNGVSSTSVSKRMQTDCFAPAMKKISECYFDGNGVSKNIQSGLNWLQSTFEYGDDINAAHELALIYEYGRKDVPVDVIAAAQWFEKAADAGHVEAMSELGLCYELGCGIEQDDEKALDWYTKAANLGHITSKFSVGEAFEAARGVPQSDEEACLWYYRAALVGDEDSKVALRRLYDIARIVVPGVSEILNV